MPVLGRFDVCQMIKKNSFVVHGRFMLGLSKFGRMTSRFFQHHLSLATLFAALLFASSASAVTNINVFFNASQTMTVVSSNMTTVTIQSEGYLFTYSQDGYFTGGVGLTNPVGRYFSVVWPNGVQAQAITVQPTPPVPSGANITIKRADGKPFDLWSFTGKLLANTAGTGGAFEIMPLVNGEDAFNDPLMFDCTGYGGQSFPHTPMLSGYDTYKIHLWLDWALTALTLIDTNPVVPPPPSYTIAATASPVGAGAVTGAGTYPSNTTCSLTATANAGWGFTNWTRNGIQVSTSPNYSFTVRSSTVLVANFITNVPPNTAPLAVGGSFFQLTGQPLVVNIADLMAFDSDPDGDAISFVSASATSSNGLALTVNTNAMQVLVPANTLLDGFSYTIADTYGTTATGAASISIITSPASQALALDLISNPGTATVSFTGVPWYSYEAQRATNAAFTGTLQTWAVQAWADGSVYIWDDFADLGASPAQAFYRLSFP